MNNAILEMSSSSVFSLIFFRFKHCKPISKTKRHTLVEIEKKSEPWKALEIIRREQNRYPITSKKRQRNLSLANSHGLSNPEIRAFLRSRVRAQNAALATSRIKTHGFEGYRAVYKPHLGIQLTQETVDEDGNTITIPLKTERHRNSLLSITKGSKARFSIYTHSYLFSPDVSSSFISPNIPFFIENIKIDLDTSYIGPPDLS